VTLSAARGRDRDGTRPHAPTAAWITAPALAALLAAALTACASPGPAPALPADAARDELDARWADLDAALAHVQKHFEMTTLERLEPEPGVRLYRLVTNLDEPVLVRAETGAPSEPREDRGIEIAVSHGLWGDAETERAIIDALRARLGWLRDRWPRPAARPPRPS